MPSQSSSCGSSVAQEFLAYRARRDVVVLGITPKAFAIASNVADVLKVPSDIFLVRDIAANDESVVGSVARGAYVPNAKGLAAAGISLSAFVETANREEAAIVTLETEYRHGRPPVPLTGTTIILVDDGTSGERELLTAMTAIRRHGINGIIVVTPLESNPQRETTQGMHPPQAT